VAPPNRGGLNSTHIHGTSVPVEEPSTASIATECTAAKMYRSFDNLVGIRLGFTRNRPQSSKSGAPLSDQKVDPRGSTNPKHLGIIGRS
jgi:hypothetical protein